AANGALAPVPARTMSPPLAQACVLSTLSTRATSVPSPSRARWANWNSSSEPQMFSPAPCTIQRPLSTRAPPRRLGEPMSSLRQPDGSAEIDGAGVGAGVGAGGGDTGGGTVGVTCGASPTR